MCGRLYSLILARNNICHSKFRGKNLEENYCVKLRQILWQYIAPEEKCGEINAMVKKRSHFARAGIGSN